MLDVFSVTNNVFFVINERICYFSVSLGQNLISYYVLNESYFLICTKLSLYLICLIYWKTFIDLEAEAIVLDGAKIFLDVE